MYVIFDRVLVTNAMPMNLLVIQGYNTVVPSKNTVSANIKHSRYFFVTFNFWSIYYYGIRFYIHMFDMVDTAFSYGRALIVC